MIHLLLHPLIALLYTSKQELFPECRQTHQSGISKHPIIILNVNCKTEQWFGLEGTLNTI